MAHHPTGTAATSTRSAPPHPSPVPQLSTSPSTDQGSQLSISEVSHLLGITAHTARYYERAGLITVSRAQSGHRTYDQKTVERLDFLVRMRSSGMGISELSRYVDLVRAGDATTEQRLQIMLEQRKRITAQIHELELALAMTDFKIATYGGSLSDNRTPRRVKPDAHQTEGISS